MRTEDALKAIRDLAKIHSQFTELGEIDPRYTYMANGIEVSARVLRLDMDEFQRELDMNAQRSHTLG